jgi:hypothetical protein
MRNPASLGAGARRTTWRDDACADVLAVRRADLDRSHRPANTARSLNLAGRHGKSPDACQRDE